jgi:hypothetical protein
MTSEIWIKSWCNFHAPDGVPGIAIAQQCKNRKVRRTKTGEMPYGYIKCVLLNGAPTYSERPPQSAKYNLASLL